MKKNIKPMHPLSSNNIAKFNLHQIDIFKTAKWTHAESSSFILKFITCLVKLVL